MDLNALIAQGGTQNVQPPNQLDLYTKAMALQHAQNQNALAQYSLSSAQRADAQTSALNDVYAKYPDFMSNPASMRAATNELASRQQGGGIPVLTQKAVDAQKAQAMIDQEKATALQRTALGNKANFELAQTRGDNAIKIIARNTTPEGVRADTQASLEKGDITPVIASHLLSTLPQDPTLLPKWSRDQLFNILDAAKQLEQQTHIVNQGDKEAIVGTSKYGGTPPTVQATLPVAMNPFQAAEIPIKQQEANARSSQAGTAAAGLPLRALQADPLGITGAQDAYPLPTLPNTAAGKNASIDPRANFTPQQIAAIQADAAKNAAPAGAAPTLGGQLTIRQAAQQGLRGNDFLGAMPALLAGQVAAIVDHRAAPPMRNTARGDQMMQLVQQVDPTYDATAYGTKAGIEKAFASGRAGDTVRTFGVVQNHLDTLTEAGNALANGNMQAFNKVGNTIAQWTGQPAPTDFNAVKRIVAGEITKAVIGAAGALGDRTAVDEALNSANSPAQLAGVVDRYKQLIRGQIDGFRKQYEAGGGAHADKIFGTTSAAANSDIDALLNKYK